MIWPMIKSILPLLHMLLWLYIHKYAHTYTYDASVSACRREHDTMLRPLSPNYILFTTTPNIYFKTASHWSPVYCSSMPCGSSYFSTLFFIHALIKAQEARFFQIPNIVCFCCPCYPNPKIVTACFCHSLCCDCGATHNKTVKPSLYLILL